jgi:peptidoglycan/xylan/chitin deacetylase (PgdA/CDA1 family)
MRSRTAAALTPLLLLLAGCGSGSGSGASTPHTTTTTTGTPARTATAAPPAGDANSALPAPAAQQAALRRFAEIGRPVFCGARHGNLVALTFDDGPGPYTSIALRELREAGAHATFFLVGASIARYPSAAKPEREIAAIGDHTMTHPDLATLAPAAAIAQVQDGRQAALDAVGPPVDLFRPPYGSHTPAIDAQVSRDGMVEVLWDVDSTDSRVQPPADYRAISRTVRRGIRPGSIVLMHENRGQTIRALRGILPVLRRRGLRSVTVPELLAADPPSDAQLAAGRDGCGRAGETAGNGG